MSEISESAIFENALKDRDRAVGAILLLAYDGIISLSRAAELLGMSLLDIRDEAKRIINEDDSE